MPARIFHGELTPQMLAKALTATFQRGDYQVRQMGNKEHLMVQIATRNRPQSGGQTALTVDLRRVADGVAVQLGEQTLWGVAASLGKTALSTWRNPWNLLDRLDDIAADVENMQLSENVWEVIEQAAYSAGASFELSERLRRLVCAYCQTANPVGEPSCIACGAPLGPAQPRTCPSCGFVVRSHESLCPNCRERLPSG